MTPKGSKRPAGGSRKSPDGLPEPAKHLSKGSRSLWASIVGRFALEPEHLSLLRLALEAVDRCDQARELLVRDGLLVEGSRGALQRHPMVDVEIQSRTAALRYFTQLGLAAYVEPGEQPRDGKGRFHE